ncbi:hypothetical protein [Pseudonocardia broussonetiae]|uniref:Uncharacterized protein n=1 Tax=Pseudonocardia broussonetiae TaxID=2736640 RepID=A0A6M6JXK2_9PSEU|nr:hypothetical protein [Pseudonocardia broussonetiae]QJY51242.1 hypothetical protein HOP40_35260 [Pseudonocardia broussonetiae]
MRHITTAPRLAIRLDDDTLLAVPPIHPHTPRHTRVRILEYVLRRQVGLAQMLAEEAADDIEGVSREHDRLSAVLRQTPHRNARGAVAA